MRAFSIKKALRNVGFSVVVALGTGMLISSSAWAQSDQGAISGSISDASGAAVTKASISIKNVATGVVRETVTNNKGEYSLPHLAPATYSITVTATGFAPFVRTMTVTVGSANTLSAKLDVSGGNTQVLVSADDSTGVQLEKAEVAQVINTDQIQALPTVDRDPYNLVSLSGNLTTDNSISSHRGVGFGVSGSREAAVDILLDGAENTDLYTVGIGQSVPMDATQEFRVVTAAGGAEYGRGSGAVNVATKSGTNALHGSAYEYNRISTFASDGYNNNYIHDITPSVSARPRYTHNQYGYSVGGPVVLPAIINGHNKLFFFSSTEWTKIRSAANYIAIVPTPQLLALTNTNTQNYFNTYGTLEHPINGLTYTGASTAVQKVWSADVTSIQNSKNIDLSSTPLFGESIFTVPQDSGGGAPIDKWISFNRGDWSINDSTSLSVRYIQQGSKYPEGYVNASPYAGYNTSEKIGNHNLLVTVNKTFSTTLASTTKLLLARNNDSQPLGTQKVSPTLYVNASASVALGGGTINFPGYSQTSPGNAIPFGGPQNEIQIAEDIALTKGRHQISFGGEYLYIRDNRTFGAYENAVDALKQSGTSGALTNLFNGTFSYLNVAVNPNGAYPCALDATTGSQIKTSACAISLPVTAPNFSRSNRYHDFAFYVADSYKANSRLTINAGLRWEIYGPQHSQKPTYDANFFLGSGSNFFEQIANGQVMTRDKAPNGRLWNLNLKQFAPKVGFAYDPIGNGKTSIRGGFGLSYERNFGNVTYNVIQNPPNYAVVAVTTSENISTNNYNTLGTSSGASYLPAVTLRAVDPHIKPAYALNYSLEVEHQFDKLTAGINYVGTRGIHNYSIANVNRAYSGSNYLGYGYTAGRNNLQYSNINWRAADGDSYYHGVNFSLRGQNLYNTGLTVTANYTWSHSIDNTSSTFTDGASNTVNSVAYLDPFNHGLDRGNADFDVRHRVTTGLIWEVPFAKHLTGTTKLLTDNWTIATTFTASTGNPFSLFDCSNAYTVCPRAAFTSDVAHKRTRNMTNLSSTYGANTFSYMSLPTFWDPEGATANNNQTGILLSNYNEQINPNTGTSDTPICSGLYGTGCHWVDRMSKRNAFSGPGSWDEDVAVEKDFKTTKGFTVQLKGEFINVFNHANTYLNLGSTTDVSSYTDVLAYKSGNRNTELSLHVSF